MGREIRRVPPDWEHPLAEWGPDKGRYRPMHDTPIEAAAQEWFAEWETWRRGEHYAQQPDYPIANDPRPYGRDYAAFVEYHGKSPDPDYYLPADWQPERATAYQVYETVTEGTPVSPVFQNTEALIAWLLKQGYSKQSARAFAAGGYAPSFVVSRTAEGITLMDGIAALGGDQ